VLSMGQKAPLLAPAERGQGAATSQLDGCHFMGGVPG